MKRTRAIVCDFDGTLSTLRGGWEAVMKASMLRHLPDERWIDAFIAETAGVQTILQMKGFVAELRRRGIDRRRNPHLHDVAPVVRTGVFHPRLRRHDRSPD